MVLFPDISHLNKSFNQLEVRRLLVLFQPAEVLNISPKIGLSNSFIIQLVLLSLRILEAIRPKDNFIAKFNDSFTGHKN